MIDRKIVDYDILYTKSSELFEYESCFNSKLQDIVKIKLKEGWTCLGAPFIDKYYVFQGMVKYEETKNEK